MLANHLPPYFLDTQFVNAISGMQGLMNGLQFSCSLVHLFKFFSGLLEEWSRISYEGDNLDIYPFYNVPAIQFGFEQLSRFPEIFFFNFFFHLHLFDVSAFNIPYLLFVRFLFFRAFLFFLDFVIPFFPSYVVSRFLSLAWLLSLSLLSLLFNKNNDKLP